MKVYCPFGLFESTGAFETKSKWLSNRIDNLHFVLLHKRTNRKEISQRKFFSAHTELFWKEQELQELQDL